jgi:hypothetical protein
MTLCEHCGAELKADARFCAQCGSSIAPASEAAGSAAHPPEQGDDPKNAQPIYSGDALNGQTQKSDPPPVQGSYTPPGQGSYTPPAPPQPLGNHMPSSQSQSGFTPFQPPQGGYAPPAPAQGGYQPPSYHGQQAAAKGKRPFNQKTLLFGAIGVVVLILIIVLASALGGGKDKTDPYLGVWKAATVEVFGKEYDAVDILEGKVELELMAGGKCEWRFEGDIDPYKWAVKGDTITVTAGKETLFSGSIKDDLIVIDNFSGIGMKLTFERDSGVATSAGTLPPGINKPGAGIPSGGAPQAGTQEMSVQERWNGSWYGYIWITEAYGDWADVEDYFDDAYMAIDVDEDGDGTMAIFIGDEEVQSIDTYIFADSNHFEVTDGVFWDMTLDPDIWWFALSPVNDGNLVVIGDSYIDPELSGGDGFDYMFCFRPFGELWVQEEKSSDMLPPSYENYAAAIKSGVSDPNATEKKNNASPTPNGDSAAFMPDEKNYGENGWVYTKSGSLRMQIPDGWKVNRTLNETNMSVKSADKDGDVIIITIDPYSSKARTPEERIRQNASDAEIFEGKWGNTDILYRFEEWSDYNQIKAYAAYDADNSIYFDIRIKKVNFNSAEDFMRSAAWDTFINTFTLTAP